MASGNRLIVDLVDHVDVVDAFSLIIVNLNFVNAAVDH